MRRGFSLIELLIVIAIIVTIIAVAVPHYKQAEIFAREMAASKAVQTIETAEVMYQSRYNRYSQTLRELGPPQSGPPSPAAAGLICDALAGGTAGGYHFSLTSTPFTFAIAATPVAYGSSGTRCFFMDESGVLRASEGPQPATVSSPELSK